MYWGILKGYIHGGEMIDRYSMVLLKGGRREGGGKQRVRGEIFASI